MGIVGGYFFPQIKQNFGAIKIPESPYLFITNLQSNIGTSDTSMTLNAGTYKNGTSLSGYNCFTVDAGTASAEYICGTASGTAISSLLRGIDPQNPAATSTALTFAHRRGADVRITDFPILQIVKRLVNGQDGFPNALQYDSTITITTIASNLSNLANVQYVNGVALQGAPVATTTTPGVVQIGTATQISAGVGMTGQYSLVPAGSLFNATPQSATTVPVTNASGKLAQGFLDLTQNWIFSGALTNISATTTLVATSTKPLILDGIAYSFPFNQGAASTTLTNNGSGTLVWDTVANNFNYKTGVAATSTTSSMVIAHGLGKVPKFIKVTAIGTGSSCGQNISVGTYIGGSYATAYQEITGACGTVDGTTDTSKIIHLQNSASSNVTATVSSVDATNITLSWTFTSYTNQVAIIWEAY